MAMFIDAGKGVCGYNKSGYPNRTHFMVYCSKEDRYFQLKKSMGLENENGWCLVNPKLVFHNDWDDQWYEARYVHEGEDVTDKVTPRYEVTEVTDLVKAHLAHQKAEHEPSPYFHTFRADGMSRLDGRKAHNRAIIAAVKAAM